MQITKIILSAILVSFFVPISVVAQSKDPAYGLALQETQNQLVNPNQRSKVIEANPESQRAYQQLKAVANDVATEQEYFELTSQIMSNYGSAENDQAFIQDIQNGLTNPEAFYNKLTDEQKRKINSLSQKISPKTGTNP